MARRAAGEAGDEKGVGARHAVAVSPFGSAPVSTMGGASLMAIGGLITRGGMRARSRLPGGRIVGSAREVKCQRGEAGGAEVPHRPP